jgi:CubicO group peptidase (beta-lactamase class C family)
MLLEEGKFSMDDPLWWFIPEFRNPQILDDVNMDDSTFTSHPAQNEIKVRQLFNHTSGLGYGYQDERLNVVYWKHGISEGFEERDILLADNIKTLAKLPLMHEPGEKWTYGLSYDALGYFIEVVSGMPLDKYLKERIFNPLGMNDTHFYLPEDKYERLPDVYMSSHEGVVPTTYELINYPIQGARKYLSGGADLSTTALDYAKFAQMIMNKGTYNGARILGSRTVEWITTGQRQGGKNAIGWGFSVVESKDEMLAYPSPGSCTWGGYFSTQCLMDPKEEIIAILMLQMDPNWEWNVHNKFHNIVYSAIDD